MSGVAVEQPRFQLDPIRRAIGGGIAGTIVMAVVLLIGEAEARFQLGLAGALARYVGVGDLPLVGLFAFLAAGMVVWPLLFLAVDPYLHRIPGGSDPAVRGIAFSVPLWGLYMLLASPSNGGLVLLLHVGFTLFAHLLYGFTLGAVYYSLSDSVSDSG